MLNNLKKSCKGKIGIKVLAVTLALMIMSSDISILGSCLISSLTSYAAENLENQTEATNNENVVFEAYFLDENGNKTFEQSKDMQESLKLYISVGVKNSGYLKNAKIEFLDNNFSSDGSNQMNEISLGTINAGTTISLKNNETQEEGIDVKPVSAKTYNLENLSKITTIKLTGEYYNAEKAVQIDSEKFVKVNWNSSKLEDNSDLLKLEQEIVTNAILDVNGEDKRVVQVDVKSYLENNNYPVSNTKINVKLPKINSEYIEPEKITVVSYETLATNGKSSVEFSKAGENENAFGTWNYNSQTQELEINVKNSEDENKDIYWGKGKDEFVITYVYAKEVEIESFESELNSEIKLYTGKTLTSKLSQEEISSVVGIVDVLVEVPEKIYKKNMNMGKTTTYSETWNVGISNLDLAQMTILVDSTVLKQENSETEVNVKYISTKIAKEDFVDILGQDGGIAVYDAETGKQIGEISLEGHEEEEYLIFEYSEEYKQIGFCFIPGENAKLDGGKLKLQHEKEIPTVNKEFVSEFTKVTSLVGGYVGTIEEDKTEKIMDLSSDIIEISLEEPTTKANFGIDFGRNDKETLPVNQENEINFTVTLKTAEDQYKLYNNPTIKIDLPEEIEEIKIEDVNLLNANGLEILSKEVIDKSIYITLKGNQEETVDLTKVDTYVQIKAIVKANEEVPTIIRNVKLTLTNGEDQIETLEEITLEQIENGLILKNDVKVGETSPDKDGKIEIAMNSNSAMVNVKEMLINNSSESLAKTEIIGDLAEEGKIAGTLKSAVEVNTTMFNGEEKVSPEIYYSVDGENWTDTFEGATKYKLVFANGILAKERIEVSYIVEIPENLKTNESINLYYTVKTEEKEDVKSNVVILATPENTENIEESPFDVKFSMETLVSNRDYLEIGDLVNYRIKLTNKTSKTIDNISLENKAIEELKYDGIGILEKICQFTLDDNGKYISEEISLEPNETKTIYISGYLIKYNKDGLKENIKIKWNENGEVKSTSSESEAVTIEEPTRLNLSIQSKSSEKEIKDEAKYIVRVENTSDKTINADLELVLSENLKLDNMQVTNQNSEVIERKTNQNQLYLEPYQNYIIEVNANVDKENAQDGEEASAFVKLNNLGLEQESNVILNTIKVEEKEEEKETTQEVVKEEISQEQTVEDKDVTKQITEEISKEQTSEAQNTKKEETTQEENVVTYSISGTAWVDENKDGVKDSSEKLLKGVLVKLKKIDTNKKEEYVKTKAGDILQVITDNNGKYEFKGLEKGNYIVEFEYNSNDYSLTPVSNKESKAIAVKENEKTTVKTDTIKLEKNIEDINIGLISNEIFDLELNKYISKVTIKTSSGTTENIYNKTQLAKAEIKAKEIKNAVVMIEYEIEVANKGEVTADSILIADYAPNDLKFTSELNTTWYQASDGTLYCTELGNTSIKSGESKTVKLVLTKTMTETNTGITNNTAEISQAHNDLGLVDVNSTPANKVEKENDFSNAEIIVSTATGSTSMYIGIVIISMLILGGGIYLINKKIILEKDI